MVIKNVKSVVYLTSSNILRSKCDLLKEIFSEHLEMDALTSPGILGGTPTEYTTTEVVY